jgi:hypothetical protein
VRGNMEKMIFMAYQVPALYFSVLYSRKNKLLVNGNGHLWNTDSYFEKNNVSKNSVLYIFQAFMVVKCHNVI